MYKGNVAYLWHQYETTTGGFSWIWNLRSRDSPDGRTVRQTGETSHRQWVCDHFLHNRRRSVNFQQYLFE